MTKPDTTTAKILKAMGQLGAADVLTIATAAGVGRSTANRKLRAWAEAEEITRIDRGQDPAHYALLEGVAPASVLTADTTIPELEPEPEDDPEPATEPEPATDAEPEADAAGPEGETDEAVGASKSGGDLPAATDTEPGPDVPVDVEPEDVEHPAGLADVPAVPVDVLAVAEVVPESVVELEGDAAAEDGDAADPNLAEVPTPEPEANVADSVVAQDPPVADVASDSIDTAGRRKPGTLQRLAVALLRARPDDALKVVEICHLFNAEMAAAEAATGDPAPFKKVSTGAMANALHSLAKKGELVLTVEKPATFQAA